MSPRQVSGCIHRLGSLALYVSKERCKRGLQPGYAEHQYNQIHGSRNQFETTYRDLGSIVTGSWFGVCTRPWSLRKQFSVRI